MAKLIKRRIQPIILPKPVIPIKPIDIKEKFKQGQIKQKDQSIVNKESASEEFIKKILNSNIAPIVKAYYVDTPVMPSRQIPYYAKKGFKTAIHMIRKAIRGTLYDDTEFAASYYGRKFSIEEILASVENHKLALTPEYKPVDKKFLRVSLDLFFHNPYSKSIGKSLFLYWLGVDPIPMLKPVYDQYPEITAEVIRLFEWGGLTYEDTIHIIKGVAQYKEILSGIQFSPIYRITPLKEAEILWIILTDLFELVNVAITPKNLVSPKFSKWILEGLKKCDYVV
jgi:hypothetical protein